MPLDDDPVPGAVSSLPSSSASRSKQSFTAPFSSFRLKPRASCPTNRCCLLCCLPLLPPPLLTPVLLLPLLLRPPSMLLSANKFACARSSSSRSIRSTQNPSGVATGSLSLAVIAAVVPAPAAVPEAAAVAAALRCALFAFALAFASKRWSSASISSLNTVTLPPLLNSSRTTGSRGGSEEEEERLADKDGMGNRGSGGGSSGDNDDEVEGDRGVDKERSFEVDDAAVTGLLPPLPTLPPSSSWLLCLSGWLPFGDGDVGEKVKARLTRPCGVSNSCCFNSSSFCSRSCCCRCRSCCKRAFCFCCCCCLCV